jgi:hypothetical protein
MELIFKYYLNHVYASKVDTITLIYDQSIPSLYAIFLNKLGVLERQNSCLVFVYFRTISSKANAVTTTLCSLFRVQLAQMFHSKYVNKFIILNNISFKQLPQKHGRYLFQISRNQENLAIFSTKEICSEVL